MKPLLDSQLPTGWSWKTISTCYRITKKPKELSYSDSEPIPFVPMEAVPVNGREAVRFEMRRHSDIASGVYFEKGDVLLSKITPSFENGKQGLAYNIPAPFGIASTEIIPLQALTPNADTHFLFFYLLHPEIRSTLTGKMEGSTGRQRVPEYVLRDFPIPLPTKLEQEKIAFVMRKTQRAIELEEELIATARELKRSVMRQVFMHGLRNERQQDTEVGLVPESWTHEMLGDVASITYGAQAAVASAFDPSIGTPIFTNINITNDGKLNLSKLRYYKVPDKHRDRLTLKKGDVLFNWRSGSVDHVGKTALFELDAEYTYSSFILRFRVREGITNVFLYYYLNYIKSEGFFSNRRNVSSINSVFNASLAATIPVYFPADTSEQNEVVDILRCVDRKIAAHERKRATLQALFKSTLHQLMTGQICVADLDIDAGAI